MILIYRITYINYNWYNKHNNYQFYMWILDWWHHKLTHLEIKKNYFSKTCYTCSVYLCINRGRGTDFCLWINFCKCHIRNFKLTLVILFLLTIGPTQEWSRVKLWCLHPSKDSITHFEVVSSEMVEDTGVQTENHQPSASEQSNFLILESAWEVFEPREREVIHKHMDYALRPPRPVLVQKTNPTEL